MFKFIFPTADDIDAKSGNFVSMIVTPINLSRFKDIFKFASQPSSHSNIDNIFETSLEILMEFLILDFEIPSNNDQKCLIFGDKLTHLVNKFNDFKVFVDFI